MTVNTNINVTEAKKAAMALRALAVEAVQNANSGHPGAPLGLADLFFQLYTRQIKHNPDQPNWLNRDRLVLSNGHASAAIYGALHLSGYALSMDEIKNFRQLNSKTPGHPEFGETPGIEVTTGPLGQGLAHGVGMALAEKLLAKEFNRPPLNVVDHHTYVIVGDGCLMEGVAQEAASLAGTLALEKLVVFWDNNQISIDGRVENWFTENQSERFSALGFRVLNGVDGHDPQALAEALQLCKQTDGRPTFLPVNTIIGYGVVGLAGSHKTHGAALGRENISALYDALQWDEEPFVINNECRALWDQTSRGYKAQKEWEGVMQSYTEEHPELARELLRRYQGITNPSALKEAIDQAIAELRQKASISTRKALTATLEYLMPAIPELLTGSADLAESNGVNWSGMLSITEDGGRHVHYGVREFGMTAAINGMVLHGGYKPFGATFLCFSDYSRPAIRLAALMGVPSLLVFTHDSLHLGEDGPTHQPVEHLASLRSIPNLSVWRPGDGVETAVAIHACMSRESGPSALVLTRQNLRYVTADVEPLTIAKGGYQSWVGSQWHNSPGNRLTLVASGSELDLARSAVAELPEKLADCTAVVSLPCAEAFVENASAWRDSIIPPDSLTIGIELASPSWLTGIRIDHWVGLHEFGASGKPDEVVSSRGFTPKSVASSILSLSTHLVDG